MFPSAMMTVNRTTSATRWSATENDTTAMSRPGNRPADASRTGWHDAMEIGLERAGAFASAWALCNVAHTEARANKTQAHQRANKSARSDLDGTSSLRRRDQRRSDIDVDDERFTQRFEQR